MNTAATAESGTRLVCGTPPAGSYDADIIILALERLAETQEAVASARGQRDARCFVWVLDQGSAPAVRAGFAAAFAGLPDLLYYEASVNLGVGGGRNFLSNLGHGKIIVALDNDAAFANANIVANALAGFANAPTLGATGFKILSRDGISLDHFSWGHPIQLIPRCDDKFEPSPSSAPATPSAAPPGRTPAATTPPCSSRGKNTISACAPSPAAGGSTTTATSP